MATEFAQRLYNPDKAAAAYTKIKVKLFFILIYYSVNIIRIKKYLDHRNIFHVHFFQCLEAIDVADSVTYVLSAPPHVQVCDFFSCLINTVTFSVFVFLFTVEISCLFAHNQITFNFRRILFFQIGDVQMRPVEQVS